MIATARTFSVVGVEAVSVRAEVDLHRGLPAFTVVGLPDAAVRESRERVRAAIVNSGFEFPQKRITANLAPGDLRKAGPGFDLAIAAAVLAASGQLRAAALDRFSLAGELALDGGIRPIPGVLAMAERAARERATGIAVAAENAAEAALVEGIEVAALARLGDLDQLGAGAPAVPPAPSTIVLDPPVAGDLADLRGQPQLRNALAIAAAGGHSLLIAGPPGAGKSLAARRLPSILPPLSRREAIEVTRIASVAGLAPRDGSLAGRPFRAPHHTISVAGLVGGGSPLRPGEITFAHHGVLFLDELAEFSRGCLEALRQPLEDGEVTIARARRAITFPARFQLVAAANPCPCGRGEDSERCRCSPDRVRRYEARLSGALADRIDLCLAVEQPSASALAGDLSEGTSAEVRAWVVAARERQHERLGEGQCNAGIDDRELRAAADLDPDAEAALEAGHARLGLSGRGWARAVRVARTCADLEGSPRVGAHHVAEALSYRRREGGGG